MQYAPLTQASAPHRKERAIGREGRGGLEERTKRVLFGFCFFVLEQQPQPNGLLPDSQLIYLLYWHTFCRLLFIRACCFCLVLALAFRLSSNWQSRRSLWRSRLRLRCPSPTPTPLLSLSAFSILRSVHLLATWGKFIQVRLCKQRARARMGE